MMPVRRYEYLVGFVLGVVFLTPLLLIGGFDTEETALGIFSSQVHYRHLFSGEWLYWFNDLGFGTPMPIGHRLDAHPAFALAGVGSLRLALSALWLFQMAVATAYTLKLLALTGVRPPLRLAVLACFVFSVSSACWFYLNDWVTFVVGWTMLPALLYYLHRALHPVDARAHRRRVVTLALVFAFFILNSHPGYVAPLAVSLAIYALTAAPRRAAVHAGLVVAALCCLAVTSERIYYFATEAGFFFPDALRVSQDEYPLGAHLRAFVLPFATVDGIGGLRFPFVGAVFILAALGSFRWWRTHDAHMRGCLVALLSSFLLSLMPPRWFALYTAASGSWLFRDPMVLFALLAGAAVLQRALDQPRFWLRHGVWILLLAQGYQQWHALGPAVQEYRSKREQGQFSPTTGPVNLPQVIARHRDAFGSRIYLSHLAQELARGSLSHSGMRVVTDLTFSGINPVNAWFKVVAMDRLFPALWLMHGYIGGVRDVVENGALLDALGVGLVLTDEEEGPVPDGLVLLERLTVETFRGPHTLLLLGNRDAWPQATVLSKDAAGLQLPRRPRCPNDRALCRDFTPLLAERRAEQVFLVSAHGRYSARLPPSDTDRLLFLSTTYRPEWRARSSRAPLEIAPVAMGFLGVHVPAGTTDVDLAFVPVWRQRLTWFSALATLSLIGFLLVNTWPRP